MTTNPYENNIPTSTIPEPTRLTVTTFVKDKVFALLFLIFSIMWIDFGMFGGYDLGHSITFGTLAVITCIYAATANRLSLMGTYYAVCAIAIAVSFTLYTTPFAKTMLFFWSIALMVLSILSNTHYGKRGFRHIADLFEFVFALPFKRIGVMFRSILANDGNSSGKKRAGSVLLGLACAVPALFIIVPLLIASDAAFEALLGNILVDNLPRIFGSVIIGVGLFILMFSAVFAAIKHIIKINPAQPESEQPKASKGVNSTAIVSFLSSIAFVYVVYLVSQFAYFFNAFAGLLPDGFTVAEYARRGFFEMTLICLINVAIIAVSFLICRKNDKGKAPLSVRFISLFICLFSLVIVSTVICKLVIYMGKFGLTELRIYTTLFCVAAAIVIICVAIRLFAKRFPYFRVAVGLLAALSVAIAFADVNTTIARYNTEAYLEKQLKQIDVEYLSSLGDSAVPYLAELTESKNKKVAREAADELIFLAYNYGNVDHTYSEYTGNFGKYTFEPDKYNDFREFNVQYSVAYEVMCDQQLWNRINTLLKDSYI